MRRNVLPSLDCFSYAYLDVLPILLSCHTRAPWLPPALLCVSLSALGNFPDGCVQPLPLESVLLEEKPYFGL